MTSSRVVAAEPSPALLTRMSRCLELKAERVSDTIWSGAESERQSACMACAQDPRAETSRMREAAWVLEDCDT